ncbi:unnamed protein product [Owenia fusiformis]|uniref:Uncharacterized protein n=1 Tax=Owenia fusiformis TaxID=6347 RepID=A0A8J1UUA5_OWEFU|nr:unnamed protein product [Owenia fusiformis]
MKSLTIIFAWLTAISAHELCTTDDIERLSREMSQLREEIGACKDKGSVDTDVNDCTSQKNGIAKITRQNGRKFDALCKNEWLIVLNRFDGSVNFNKGWDTYKSGLGDVDGEYFIGLENLVGVLKQGKYKLRVELTTWPDDGSKTKYADYGKFDVGDESENYRLTVGEYSGTAGDSIYSMVNRDAHLWTLNGFEFTTYDRDNDNYFGGNCANWKNANGKSSGPMWFNHCSVARFFAPYMKNSRCKDRWNCIVWYFWPDKIGKPDNSWYHFKELRLMIKPTS